MNQDLFNNNLVENGLLSSSIAAENHEASKFILFEILHSMSLLSNPGEENIFSFRGKFNEGDNHEATHKRNSVLISQDEFSKQQLHHENLDLDGELKSTLKDTQISTVRALLNRIKKEVKIEEKAVQTYIDPVYDLSN